MFLVSGRCLLKLSGPLYEDNSPKRKSPVMYIRFPNEPPNRSKLRGIQSPSPLVGTITADTQPLQAVGYQNENENPPYVGAK